MALMHLSSQLAKLPGVHLAAAIMLFENIGVLHRPL